MLDKILKAFRYYILHEPMVLQFGENDFRVCKFGFFGVSALDITTHQWWNSPKNHYRRCVFTSAHWAIEAKKNYLSKGVFVNEDI